MRPCRASVGLWLALCGLVFSGCDRLEPYLARPARDAALAGEIGSGDMASAPLDAPGADLDAPEADLGAQDHIVEDLSPSGDAQLPDSTPCAPCSGCCSSSTGTMRCVSTCPSASADHCDNGVCHCGSMEECPAGQFCSFGVCE